MPKLNLTTFQARPLEAIPVAEKQIALNDSTRGQWQMYATHRQEVERLLVASVPPTPGRLCVLGAGNCNDLDLNWLTQVFRGVWLVDIDAAALERAVKRQKVARRDVIHCYGSFDLTGIARRTDRWAGRTPPDEEIDAALKDIFAAPPPGLPGKFDVVLSPCALSQFFNPVRDAMGATHPRFRQVLAAIRSRHLRMLLDVLTPGGRAILVNDISSNERFAPLPRIPNDQLPDVMRKVLDEGKYFRGLEPASIIADLRSDPRVAKWEASAPWLWHLGMKRTYLVYAILLWHGFPTFPTRGLDPRHGLNSLKTRPT